MTTGEKGRRAAARRAWVACGIVAVSAALVAGCGERKDAQKVPVGYEAPPVYDRDLNPNEADSMRAMKLTHNVTRDEYWQQRGGVIANDHLEVWYSDRKIYVLDAMAVLKLMDQARSRALKTFGRVPPERLVVACAPSLEVFMKQTGRDWWHYAQTKGDTLNLQNPMLLYTRGLLAPGAQHEYYEWAIGKLTQGRTPRWVSEGMSAYMAREAPVFVDQRREYIDRNMRMKPEDVEKTLAADRDRVPARIATYNAYLMIEKLVESKGMPAVAAFVLAFGEEPSPDAVARRIFNQSYDEVLALAAQWAEPAPPVMQPAQPAPADTSNAGHTH